MGDQSVSPFELAKALRTFLKIKTIKSAKKILLIADTDCPVLETVDQCVKADCPFIAGKDCCVTAQPIAGFNCEKDSDIAMLYLEATILLARWNAAPRSVKDRLRRLANGDAN